MRSGRMNAQQAAHRQQRLPIRQHIIRAPHDTLHIRVLLHLRDFVRVDELDDLRPLLAVDHVGQLRKQRRAGHQIHRATHQHFAARSAGRNRYLRCGIIPAL